MKRYSYPVVAAALAGSMLPFGALMPASADEGDGPPAFSGYSTSATSSPVKVEIFEPTIPIPASPQLELMFGYTRIKADSSTTKGRATFLWPGDPVGEGTKTIVEQAGLPPQLGERGYPFQVNSSFPSGAATEKQEPFPGVAMRTTSGDKTAEASIGYSSNCNVADGESSGDSGDGGGGGGVPGLPEIPGLPELPGLDALLGGLGRQSASVSRSSDRSRTGASAEPCQIPDALAAVIDIGGYISDTASDADKSKVTTTSRAALGDVKLIGGLVTMSGITAKVTSASDGKAGTSKGRADYGTMTIAGQTFAFGPEGYVAVGQSGPIPGLPDDPAAALAMLGITITVPQPTYKVVDDKAVGTVEGLIVTIDMKVLAPVLKQIPLREILNAIPFPPEMKQLKSALDAAGGLSPKYVIHLGYATSTVDTVQPIEVPDSVPDNDPGGEDETTDTTEAGQTAGGGVSGGGASSGLPPTDTTAAPTDASAGTLDNAELTSGLPPLFSIPGLLMALGIGGALLAGNYVRRIGAMVLGGAGACTHGLASGLPDLRKVQ